LSLGESVRDVGIRDVRDINVAEDSLEKPLVDVEIKDNLD
jgi:hypothetical protein